MFKVNKDIGMTSFDVGLVPLWLTFSTELNHIGCV